MSKKAPIKIAHRLLVALLTLVLVLGLVPYPASAAQAAGAVIHVNINAAPGGDGASWATAYKYLQDGIAAATDGDEIWVAKGTHYPDEGAGVTDNDRNATFTLNSGVKIYGGFAGTESALDQRNWVANPTVLSGDIDQDASTDGCSLYPDPCNTTKNSYHVVTSGPAINNEAILDGFTVTGGRGNATDRSLNRGAGILLIETVGPGTNWTVALHNLTVEDNHAYNGDGGGLYAQSGDLTLKDVTLVNNIGGDGGGARLQQVDHFMQKIVVRDNEAFRGGGLHIGRPPANPYLFHGTILDADISGNRAATQGGGIYFASGVLNAANWRVSGNVVDVTGTVFDGFLQSYGGGIYTGQIFQSKISNITVTGNRATNDAEGAFGGGIALNCDLTDCNLAITNSVIHGNTATSTIAPNVLQPTARHKGDVSFQNSLIEGSNGSGGSWALPRIQDLGGNIDADPQFLIPIASASAPTTAGNFRQKLGSPLINAGDNSLIAGTPAISTDLAGFARIYDTTVDMGAYETQITCPAGATTRLYVSSTASGAGTGTSWTDALPRLQDAVTLADSCPNNSIAEVWVAQGTYYPDEGNGVANDDRSAAFPLRNGLSIYGGFLGNETDLNQRDPWSHITTLSGDIGQDDKTDANDLVETPADIVGDNSYHVVVGSGTDSSAVLDGFAITAGQANGSAAAKQHEGGGFFAEAGSPTLNNLALVGNIAEEGGAMTLVGGSNPVITNAWFGGNAASDYGGALHNESSHPILTNVQMSGNRAAAGGGAIYNLLSSPELTNVSIAGNAAGGTVSLASVSPGAVDIAPAGGGILNFTGSKPDIRNSVIWANEDSTGIGTASASMRNLDVGSTPSADHSDIQGLASITGLLYDGTSVDADPLFVTNPDPSAAPAFGQPLRLKTGSPAIDAGNNSFNGLPADLAGGQVRIQDGDGDGTATIDMGAFEAPLLLVPKIQIRKSASTITANIGDAITYSYVVTNTGNVTVTLAADDDKLGSISLTPSTLGPGAGATAGKTYTATAGDLPVLVNTVHVTGTAPGGSEAHEAATAHVDLQVSTQMAVTKTASVASAEVGSTVYYTYEVKNIGTGTLTITQAVDDKLGAVAGLPASLAAGNTAQTSLSYVVQESDLPILNNQVTVTATVGISTEVEYAVATVKVTSSPAIVLHKSADRATAKVGDAVTYSYEVRNTGDVSLSNLVLADSRLGPIPLGVSTLAPNASKTVTGTHVVVEGDLPGPLTNTAVVTGSGPTGAVRTSQDGASVALSYRPRLEVEKTASPVSALPGEVVTYTYVVKNTGDVSLSSVSASDSALGPVTLSAATLAPGASATGTLNYTVQASDLPGPLVNTVEAQGTSPVGTVVKGTDSATVSVVDPNPPVEPSELYLPLIQK